MRIDTPATLLLLFAAVNLARADCSWGGNSGMNCGSVGENSTYAFSFRFDDNSTNAAETIDAVITFNWGVSIDTTSETLDVGKPYTFENTYAYDEAGYYVVGYEISFQAGCGDGSASSSALLRVEEDSCKYGVTTNAPTVTSYPSATPTVSPAASATTRIETQPIATVLLTFLLSAEILLNY